MQHFTRARQTRASSCAALFALLGWIVSGSACQSESVKKKEDNKPATAVATAPKPAALPSNKPKAPPPKLLQWDDPKVWKKVPASGMRVASYQIPPTAGDKEIAELNVFSLGGDVESNIQRWIDEFSGFDPKTLTRSDRVVNDLAEAVVEIPKGKFSGGMGEGNESDNFGLLGAIVTTPENIQYFFKLTGPSATVKAAHEPFYQLLDSVRLEGGTAAPTTAKTIRTIGGSTPSKPATTGAGATSASTPSSAGTPRTPSSGAKATSAAPPANH
jgi:hypothetical protein